MKDIRFNVSETTISKIEELKKSGLDFESILISFITKMIDDFKNNPDFNIDELLKSVILSEKQYKLELVRESQRRWQSKNRELNKIKCKEYKSKNKDKVRLYVKKYVSENREKINKYFREYYQRKIKKVKQ